MTQITLEKYRMISFTDKGLELIRRIAGELSGKKGEDFSENKVLSLKDWTRENFCKGNVLLFAGACGIAVRAIAPFIADKTTDPAVLVMDEKGEFVIPILSGHLGGAVACAKEIAEVTGAVCVLTTATDVEGEFAVDVYADRNGLVITDMKKAKDFTAKLLKTGSSTCYIDSEYEEYLGLTDIPSNIKRVGLQNAELVISPKKYEGSGLWLIPKCIVVGMGCKKGKTKEELSEVLLENLSGMSIDVRAVAAISSADIKKEEQGLIELCRDMEISFATFSAKELMEQKGEFTSSEFVKDVTGVDNVCERAVCAYGAKKLIVRKTAQNGVTFAAGVI